MMPRRPAQHSLSLFSSCHFSSYRSPGARRGLWQPFCPLTLVTCAKFLCMPRTVSRVPSLEEHPLMQRGDREACQRESTCTKMEKTLSFSQ